MTWRDLTDPLDFFDTPSLYEDDDNREATGYYDSQDGYRDRDLEPGPLTRHADPLAPGPF
jgi:hypothetical protein